MLSELLSSETVSARCCRPSPLPRATDSVPAASPCAQKIHDKAVQSVVAWPSWPHGRSSRLHVRQSVGIRRSTLVPSSALPTAASQNCSSPAASARARPHTPTIALRCSTPVARCVPSASGPSPAPGPQSLRNVLHASLIHWRGPAHPPHERCRLCRPHTFGATSPVSWRRGCRACGRTVFHAAERLIEGLPRRTLILSDPLPLSKR